MWRRRMAGREGIACRERIAVSCRADGDADQAKRICTVSPPIRLEADAGKAENRHLKYSKLNSRTSRAPARAGLHVPIEIRADISVLSGGQTRQTNRGSISDKQTSSCHLSALIAVQWLHL